jgi:hypothetical protein
MNLHYKWYLVPSIGLSTLLWGILWYAGLKLTMHFKGQDLIVSCKPYILQDEENGEWVMKYEIVQHMWMVKVAVDDAGDNSD